jgi:polyisoprenoid-binding protein YceI
LRNLEQKLKNPKTSFLNLSYVSSELTEMQEKLKMTFTSLLIALVLQFSLAGLTSEKSADVVTYSFNSTSTVQVHGTSTLHDWTSDVTEFTGTFKRNGGNGIESIESLQFKIDAESIKSGKSGMDRRTYSALETKKHPTITYNLVNIAREGENGDGWSVYNSVGDLEIAGKKKAVNFTVEGKENADGSVEFRGSTSLLMTEFGIDPPTAMLGTVRAGDEITIEFHVIANPK